MASKWKAVLIRFVESEVETLDAYCRENHVKRTNLIRSATRVYVANRDLVNGVIRLSDTSVDIAPVMDSIGLVIQKVEALDKRLNSSSVENGSEDLTISKRIAEAVLMVKRRAKKDVTTVDQLREKLKSLDPSVVPFLHASDSKGICGLDEALRKLEEKGELSREYGGIIRFRK